ncbi:Gfo/Idh/MocA family protein [Virgibacillus doumboii]|uniref:Gfo/Idh/MocA family protein n=1 Tax=Virgibacillus doumboii TaxID=2697503 RepID=UPI0013DEF716|nr:Gfo/Idh/MocA family oxidoreductase [Virgibacillus doumboii]
MLKVVVIGTGSMGETHLNAWSDMSDVEIVAIFGRKLVKTNQLAQKYNCKAASSFEEIIETEDFNLVDICLPTFLHKEFVKKAAFAKKDIICEKPLGLNVRECMEMKDLCEANNVRLFPAHVLRFFPEYRQIHDQLREGTIGRPTLAHLSRGGPYPASPDSWYSNPDYSGGVILDLIIHDIDWLLWTFGKVKQVSAVRINQTLHNQPLEYALVTLRFENDMIATINASWGHFKEFGTSVEITGDEGIVALNNRADVSNKVEGVTLPDFEEDKNPYQIQLEHFKDCIVSGKEPDITLNEAIEAVKICETAINSAKEKTFTAL